MATGNIADRHALLQRLVEREGNLVLHKVPGDVIDRDFHSGRLVGEPWPGLAGICFLQGTAGLISNGLACCQAVIVAIATRRQ
jgi:hypothetical protein